MRVKDENGDWKMQEIPSPICITSTAFQKLADVHNNMGEVSVAESCAETNLPMILSSNSTATIEEVAKVNPKGIKLFQIYMSK